MHLEQLASRDARLARCPPTTENRTGENMPLDVYAQRNRIEMNKHCVTCNKRTHTCKQTTNQPINQSTNLQIIKQLAQPKHQTNERAQATNTLPINAHKQLTKRICKQTRTQTNGHTCAIKRPIDQTMHEATDQQENHPNKQTTNAQIIAHKQTHMQ